jgi:hypothetical protein
MADPQVVKREMPLILVVDVISGRALNVFPAEEVTCKRTIDEAGEASLERNMDIPACAFDAAEKHLKETGHETVVALTVRRFK